MSFLSNFKKIFHIGGVGEERKKPVHDNIIRDVDPEEVWSMVGDLGDGAFGKVYKVKIVPLGCYLYYRGSFPVHVACAQQ